MWLPRDVSLRDAGGVFWVFAVIQQRSYRIAIVGAGAIGCYYGARLALGGEDVRFLMRSDLEAVRAHGITLREKDATRRLAPVAAFARADEIGPVDLVVVALKTTANSALPTLLPPLLKPDTVILTLQNGLGSEEFIAALVGEHRVLGGLCYIAVTREAPGELLGHHTPGAITFGEFGRPATACVQTVAETFAAVGVKTRVLDNLAEARWQKLIWNVPFNGLAIVGGGLATDRILADPELAAQVRPLMEEIAAAARHFGYEITPAFIQSQIDVTPPMGPYKPSSLVDYLAGREVEVEAIWGEPLRRAQQAGLAMPLLTGLYTRLRELTARPGMAR
jgi:2-dehydropantoate 2-reductase